MSTTRKRLGRTPGRKVWEEREYWAGIVGEKIYRRRYRLGLSQEALAPEIGVSRETIRRFENGESMPDWQTLLKLAEYFGVSPISLLPNEWKKGKSATPTPKTNYGQSLAPLTAVAEPLLEVAS